MTRVILVEMSPEMRAALEAARIAETEILEELHRLLTPEAVERILAGEREFTRRSVLGPAARIAVCWSCGQERWAGVGPCGNCGAPAERPA